MPTPANPTALAQQARRSYAERLLAGMPAVVQAIDQGAKMLAAAVAEPAVALKRRELLPILQRAFPIWQDGMTTLLRTALATGTVVQTRLGELSAQTASSRPGAKLSLVDDDTIEHEILSSRLALAMMDRASWEFTDLRSRMNMLESREELDANDILRPHVLARIVTSSWLAAPLGLDAWRLLQVVVHEEFSLFAEEAYHETNRFLLQRHVLPEVDLRPFIRRSNHGGRLPPIGSGGGFGTPTGVTPSGPSEFQPSATRASAVSEVGEETRLMTRAAGLARSNDQAEAVLGRLNRLVGRQLPDFAVTSHAPAPPSPRLNAAIVEAQESVARRLATAAATDASGRAVVNTPALLEELHQRKQALKQAAASPVERATIEIVALLFQSILMEDAIPATVRVWFARLQMPVLRVAVSEPDFFATVEHPARRLIDRMGSCVMGFDSGSRAVGEQRETMAIQYTIELRKMLNDVPVQEGVREFLFHVWADVLATTGVKTENGEAVKEMKRAAADLIWSASAKVSRSERAEVIRRLPPLLKTLRDGMDEAGIPVPKQDEHIQRLNNSLAAAFTAKAAAISHERLEELMGRLETLEELLPEAEDVDIDESLVMDLSGHESSELEVVGEGGSMPTPAMLAWARELQVGSWYMLDYRNRNEAMQLAWQGMRRQLTLFVSPQGRGVLFQQHRLAAFLQAGLLVPAQEEALTVRATRSAMAKLDGDPSRLLN